MENSRFKEFAGQEVFVLKFDVNSPEEAVPVIDECARQVRSRPEGSVLTLTIVSRGMFDTEFISRLKELTHGNKPFVRKAAVVGITGVYKIALSAVNIFSKREFGVFDTEEEAIQYLLAD